MRMRLKEDAVKLKAHVEAMNLREPGQKTSRILLERLGNLIHALGSLLGRAIVSEDVAQRNALAQPFITKHRT